MVAALVYTWEGTPRDGARKVLRRFDANDLSDADITFLRDLGITSTGEEAVRDLIDKLDNAPYLWAEQE